jgi:tRNA(Ile)-lysidine synthase
LKVVLGRVLRSVRRLIPPGSRVVAAVSGGPDSVALASILAELQRPGRFELVAIAHFNHRLRGVEADADEEFCRSFAKRLSVGFVSESADVRAAARDSKRSVEDTARRLRYEFLERARLSQAADLIAVGQTRDDQAETFLLRLLRGAGTRGLRGILERRGTVVRPLLEIGRPELHAWIEARSLTYRVDATNADLQIPRNRIRHDILPRLEALAPGASETLARTARLLEADDDYLDSRAIEAAAEIVLVDESSAPGVNGPAIGLNLVGLRKLHPAIARRVVRRTLAAVAPGRYLTLKHVDAVLSLDSGSLDLPDAVAQVDPVRQTLTVRPLKSASASAPEVPGSNVFRYPLSIPGEALIPESGVAIAAEVVGSSVERPQRSSASVYVNAEAVAEGLWVRGRLAGDRLRPLGLGGTKKLQDYFVDRKVPRDERDRVPLVVDGRNRIVWVVGHTIAEEFAVTAGGGAVLLLKVRQLGDSV